MSLFSRVPIPVLGLILVVSSLQTSCGGEPDTDSAPAVIARDVADAGVDDAPSDDSPDDRADGMSYGDGYGK